MALLQGWGKHDEDDSPSDERDTGCVPVEIQVPIVETSSSKPAAAGELLCGWKHDDVATSKPSTSSHNNINNNNHKDTTELLCGWSHFPEPVITKTPVKRTHTDKTESNTSRCGDDSPTFLGWKKTSHQKDDLLVNGTKSDHAPAGAPCRNSFAQEGRTTSAPDLSADGRRGFLSKVGSSVRDMLKSNSSDHKALDRNSFNGRLQTWEDQSKYSDNEEDSDDDESESDDADDDRGVVTYLGREYRAQDLAQIRRQRNLPKPLTRDSVSLDDDHHQDEGLKGALARHLGIAKPPAPGKFSHLGIPKPPMGVQRSSSLGSRPFPLSLPPPTTMRRAQSTALTLSAWNTSLILDQLSVRQNDVWDIAENPQDFAALKRSLKKSHAVTNGILQQGLHFYVHQSKQRRQKQRELEEEQQQQQLQQHRASTTTPSRRVSRRTASRSPMRNPTPGCTDHRRRSPVRTSSHPSPTANISPMRRAETKEYVSPETHTMD